MLPDPEPDRDDRPWRPAASGPSFVYVLPCLGEDLLKLGMSRDPLGRFQSLHSRWFEFFDLDAVRLVQTDSVREAGAIETRLRHALREHNAPAPLLVSAAAGGHTEWFRGALEMLAREADALSGRALNGLERTLRDALDAYDALGIEPDSLVPEAVLRWWHEARRWG